MLRVLITGITGFLGSHIAERLIQNNVQVIGLKRIDSDIWRCSSFKEEVEWVDIDDTWKTVLIKKKPHIIIHCAWIGVEAKFRDDWKQQLKNIEFLVELLHLGQIIQVKKFIFLGSQAEYGLTTGKVSECHSCSPVNAYGAAKLAALELFKTFGTINNTNWIWLRIFSVFGEKENENWLIPSVINKIQNDSPLDLTAGEQLYAYLYVKDFSTIINAILNRKIQSGVYNVSSNEVLSLKCLIERIRDQIKPLYKLNFGSLNYRENQPMHIEGDISKLEREIGKIRFTDFNEALNRTIKYYI